MVHRPVHFFYYALCFAAVFRISVNRPSRPTDSLNSRQTTGSKTNLDDAAEHVVSESDDQAASQTEQPQRPISNNKNDQAKVAPNQYFVDEKKTSFTTARSEAVRVSTAVHPPSSTLSSQSRRQLRPYPRWSGGIAVAPLVEAIRLGLSGPIFKYGKPTVYLVDSQARLWRDAHSSVPMRRGKAMESLVISVFHKALQEEKGDDFGDDYPYLKKAVRDGGFAYMVNYHDTNFCCDSPPLHRGANGKKPSSSANVPIVTLSAPVDCNHSFPVPTYATIEHARNPLSKRVAHFQNVYPWSEKKRAAVWRGTATGNHLSTKNTRVQLCKLAAKRPDLVDAKLTQKRQPKFVNDFNETWYMGASIHMPDFQKYRAIVDVDGESWSSRFGELLCYSSVVLKVQPADVDYFYPQLQPWVHYIPVQSDLSDLYEMVELAVSDDDPRILQIVRNANDWCLQHLPMETVERDMARIWDTYAFQLYQADPSWNSTWQTERESLRNDFNFTLVE